MQAPAPLRIALGRSPLLVAAAVAMHGTTIALVCVLPLPILARASAIGLVALHLVWVLWRHAWHRGAAAIIGMVLHADRTAELERRSGERQVSRIGDHSFVSAPLTVIHAYPRDVRPWPWNNCAILILPDMLDAETYRQLRVLLRLGKSRADQSVR